MHDLINVFYKGKSRTLKVVDALFFAKSEGDSELWKLVLSTTACKDYLLKESPSQIYAVAKQLEHWRVWRVVLAREDVIQFLDF